MRLGWFPQCRDIIAGTAKGKRPYKRLVAISRRISFELRQQYVLDIDRYGDPSNDLWPKVDRRRCYQLLRQRDDMKIVVKMVPLPAMLGVA